MLAGPGSRRREGHMVTRWGVVATVLGLVYFLALVGVGALLRLPVYLVYLGAALLAYYLGRRTYRGLLGGRR